LRALADTISGRSTILHLDLETIRPMRPTTPEDDPFALGRSRLNSRGWNPKSPVIAEARRQAAQLEQELAECDAELARVANQRRQTAIRLYEVYERAMSRIPWQRSRRPVFYRTHRDIAPVTSQPNLLWGRVFRAACLDIIELLGRPATLSELHHHLHLRGLQIASDTPVKALADAMAYEVRAGRAIRVERGVYGLNPRNRRKGPSPTRLPPIHPEQAFLPFLDDGDSSARQADDWASDPEPGPDADRGHEDAPTGATEGGAVAPGATSAVLADGSAPGTPVHCLTRRGAYSPDRGVRARTGRAHRGNNRRLRLHRARHRPRCTNEQVPGARGIRGGAGDLLGVRQGSSAIPLPARHRWCRRRVDPSRRSHVRSPMDLSSLRCLPCLDRAASRRREPGPTRGTRAQRIARRGAPRRRPAVGERSQQARAADGPRWDRGRPARRHRRGPDGLATRWQRLNPAPW